MADEKSITKVFGERLKNLRTDRGESQSELAKALSVSRSAIGYYENAERTADIMILHNAAKHFDVPIGYLMGYTLATKDENISVCDQTGLSEEAIQSIIDLKNSESDDENEVTLFKLADLLLSTHLFKDLLELAQEYTECTLEIKRLSREERESLRESTSNADTGKKIHISSTRDYQRSNSFLTWQVTNYCGSVIYFLGKAVEMWREGKSTEEILDEIDYREPKGGKNNGNNRQTPPRQRRKRN